MKNIKYSFLALLVILSLLLSSCSLLMSPEGTEPGGTGESLQGFDFVTDDKMVADTSSARPYCVLRLFAGESYRIKTTVDDELGDEYYLKYSSEDDISGKFTISDDGVIETSGEVSESEVFAIDVELYRKGDSRRIAKKYFIFSLLIGEYANISLKNENMSYDSDSSTYSVTVDSGSILAISYEVSYNTSYVISFALSDDSYSDFMSVDSDGIVSVKNVREDKTGEIEIKTVGSSGTLDTVTLRVSVVADATLPNEIKLTSRENGEEINTGDTVEIYKGGTLTLDAAYNGSAVTPDVTLSAPAVLICEGSELRAVGIGECEVTVSYLDTEITFTVSVKADRLTSLVAPNGGADFVIINGTLHYLKNISAVYESGKAVEITDNSLITVSLGAAVGAYKPVSFTYTDEGDSASVTYDVKFYTAIDYEGERTAYNANDLAKCGISEMAMLGNSGTLKLLAIPVWFSDSDTFFTEAQKPEILSDLEYILNGERPNGEFMSLRQYYEAQSYGKIDMDITLSEFYPSETSYRDYTDNEEDKRENSHILADAAIRWYFDTHTDESLADYDANSDGHLDGVIIYYGANYYGAEGDKNKSTAFASYAAVDSDYAFNTFAFCPIGGIYGRDFKDPAQQLASADLSVTFSRAFKIGSKTVIHEVGHMFGNDDLYEDQFADARYSPAGSFVMQDGNSCSHDPYHVNIIGWSEPAIFASSDYALGDRITVHINDFQSSGQNIILTNRWNDKNSLFDEYLIIELFAPIGLNAYDSGADFVAPLTEGIRLWHVNASLTDYSNGEITSEIIEGNQYTIAYSNYDVASKYDLLHLIRNNTSESYNTESTQRDGGVLFGEGDSFDMESFGSQFANGGVLDCGEKLGWEFKVERIYLNTDGTYGAVITLERVDNVRTDFTESAALNRSDLKEPDGLTEYSEEIFGAESNLTLTYKYVTPPSVYNQGYPISEDGMCLFASADGEGGYIDITVKRPDGKTVRINSVTVTYSKLTNASPTAIADGTELVGTEFTPENSSAYGITYEVNSESVRIQNRYDGEINQWSPLPLLEITVDYTIE